MNEHDNYHLINIQDLRRVRLEPGDILVLTYPGRLSLAGHDAIRTTFNSIFPGHRIIVLEDGMSLGVVAAEKSADVDQSGSHFVVSSDLTWDS